MKKHTITFLTLVAARLNRLLAVAQPGERSKR